MSMEAFLHYWNTHDTMIIQSLVVFILFLVIFLAVRMLFGKDQTSQGQEYGKGDGVALSAGATAEIEKTLTRILENQSQIQSGQQSGLSANFEQSVANNAGASQAVAQAEVSALQVEVKKREDKISSLERQLEQVQTELTNQPKAGPPGDVVVLQEKMKTLESRLSEYEIISEDIADLSFYKEENTRLQAELAKVLAAGASAPQAASPEAVKPAPAAPVVQPAPAAAVEEPAETSAGGIDDDIMAQFAAAVDEQKAASAAAKAAKAGAADKPSVDGELMGKFEDFVKKG
jgi:predicted RNase H-like nuclease (RuvC/YqgF family)